MFIILIVSIFIIKDIDAFHRFMKAPDSVLTDKESLQKYNEEATHVFNGLSNCVLRPSTVEEVSKILAYCNERKLAIVPQGGRTSLVEGGISVFDEIVINLERMNAIHEFSPYSGILKLEAGVILAQAQNYCLGKDFVFPLDIGAKVFLMSLYSF